MCKEAEVKPNGPRAFAEAYARTCNKGTKWGMMRASQLLLTDEEMEVVSMAVDKEEEKEARKWTSR